MQDEKLKRVPNERHDLPMFTYSERLMEPIYNNQIVIVKS